MSVANALSRQSRRVLRGITRRVQTSVFALGDSVECCLCGWTGYRFLPAGRQRTPNRLCPGCGSLQRYRALKLYIDRHRLFSRSPCTVLEIAPKPSFARWCHASGVRYIGCDLESPHAVVRSDLRQLSFVTASVDLVCCLHVLEHITEDTRALSEMRRILRPGGAALIMVPLGGRTTLEESIADPIQREVLYGQHDHVRLYGLDIAARIAAAGFSVGTVDLLETSDMSLAQRYALHGDDRILFHATTA